MNEICARISVSWVMDQIARVEVRPDGDRLGYRIPSKINSAIECNALRIDISAKLIPGRNWHRCCDGNRVRASVVSKVDVWTDGNARWVDVAAWLPPWRRWPRRASCPRCASWSRGSSWPLQAPGF